MQSLTSTLLEALAVLLWGFVAVALLFAFAVVQGATGGLAFAVLTAGSTYVYQAVQYQVREVSARRMVQLQLIPVVFYAISFILSLKGF